MSRATAAAALTLALLAPSAGAAAAAEPDLRLPGLSDAGALLVSRDADGGRTLRLHLDDGEGGTYAYTALDLSWSGANVREAGAYDHAWTHRGSPMLTIGAYVVHADEGLLRAPLAILENVSRGDDLVNLTYGILFDESYDLTLHALPLLYEYAAPELGAEMARWPADDAAVDTFRDHPRIHVWTVRKTGPAGDVWEGAYLDRSGFAHGGTGPTESFEGAKSIEVGHALRVNDATSRLGGVYAESRLSKAAGAGQTASHRLTVGAVADPLGRVPLAGVELADERTGVRRATDPDTQRSGVVLGAYVASKWTPLVGSWTGVDRPAGGVPGEGHRRVTSVGVYVDGSYRPLAGARYEGERTAPLHLADRQLSGGGPGSATVGGWRADFGVFEGPRFVPLAGAAYADEFPEARFAHAAFVTAGPWAAGSYVPLVAAAYEGERPLLDWAGTVTSGTGRAGAWIASTGTVLLDRYVPVAGARSTGMRDEPGRAVESHYEVGAFLGRYDAFVPLARLDHSGDRSPTAWATSTATGGVLGTASGDWDATAGAVGPAGPVGVEVRHRSGAPGEAATFVTVGVNAGESFIPLAGASYTSTRTPAASLGRAQDPKDDVKATITVGVYVEGRYVPLVAAENDGRGTSVTLLPGPPG